MLCVDCDSRTANGDGERCLDCTFRHESAVQQYSNTVSLFRQLHRQYRDACAGEYTYEKQHIKNSLISKRSALADEYCTAWGIEELHSLLLAGFQFYIPGKLYNGEVRRIDKALLILGNRLPEYVYDVLYADGHQSYYYPNASFYAMSVVED